MRLAITRSGFYNADFYCADAGTAKRALRENSISILAIDYYLVGRSNGCEVIDWAARNLLLPNFVVLIERNRQKRVLLANTLRRVGFRSGDNTTFIGPQTH